VKACVPRGMFWLLILAFKVFLIKQSENNNLKKETEEEVILEDVCYCLSLYFTASMYNATHWVRST